MPSKIILVFNASGGAGWTETWYNINDFGVTARQNAITLAGQRANLLGFGVSLVAARISPATFPPDPPSGLAMLAQGQLSNGFSVALPNTAANRADTAQATILARASTGAGNKRQVWLSGGKDDWIFRAGSNPAVFPVTYGNPDFIPKWQTFQNYIQQQPQIWGMKVRNKLVGVNPVRAITTVTRDTTDTWFRISTAVAHGFADGDQVAITGARGVGIRGLNGYHRVRLVIDATAFVIDQEAPPGAITPTPGFFGTVQRMTFTIVPITSLELVRVSNRKRGRALFVPRGRRRVAK
jgi:hypothetical protein